MNRIIAIIPARGGSKGLVGKNVRLLGGYPLISYSIIASRLSQGVQRTIVSTDSPQIKDISLRYGAEVPFLRPAEFARDDSPDSEFVLHAIKWFEDNGETVPDYIVHLRPTTPLREPRVIQASIAEMKGCADATSLRSGHPASESPFKWFVRDERGFFKGFSGRCSNEQLNKPRQSFPEVYIPDGYVDILKTSFIKESGMLHGERIYGFLSPVCQEVDTQEDFEYLEFLISKKRNPVYEYLKEHYPVEAL